MPQARGGRVLRRMAQAAGALLLVILLGAGVSFLSNRNLPTRSRSVDHLSAQEKQYLAEALQLKQTLGEAVWPDWAQAKIPVVIYNEEHGFLVNASSATANSRPVPNDTFAGQPYFRVPPPKEGAFTERIGEQWAATIGTKEWMRIQFMKEMREQLPRPLRPIFPYRLLTQFLSMNSSDLHVVALLHESVHAYQAQAAQEHFAAARAAYAASDRYPWDDANLRSAWKSELELLARAAEAKSPSEARDLAGQFLDHRRQRREQNRLDEAMTAFEKHMEWLEGLGKYVELAMWQKAFRASGRNPSPELAADKEFKNYAEFPQRWSGELITMKMQASQRGDIRFYYSGMAQAFLLDQLQPDWKNRILQTGTSLESLLAEAVEPTKGKTNQ